MTWLTDWTYRKSQPITAQGSIAGTIAVTNGLNTVVGTGTFFTQWGVGNQIQLPDDNWYTISTITDNTHLTITIVYPGADASGETYDMRLINYQMKLLVGESSGATGEDVDCNSHVKTDFSDLRFTTSDGETILDYWIESITGTTPNQLATVWIEFDSIGTGDTTFFMYYGNANNYDYNFIYFNGGDGFVTGVAHIGLAYGLSDYGFTKYADNPVLSPGPDAYDAKNVGQPFVIKIGSQYVMYYGGLTSADVYSINIATSDDGITWTKYASNPVLQKGAAEQWDDVGVLFPVVYDTEVVGSKRYRMLYTGYDGTKYQIGYAYSETGFSWSRGGENPVIAIGGGGSWDDTHAGVVSRIYLSGSTYYAYYGGHDGTRWQIGLATFTDFEGVYTKHGNNPLIASRTSAKQNLTAQTDSGDKTVTVADTSVFVEDEPVFLCDGTNSEFNRVASITDGTHLELENNAERNYSPDSSSNIRSWMYGSLTPGHIKVDGGTWKATFTAFQALTLDYAAILRETTAYATSADGISWTIDYANSPPLPFSPSVLSWDKISAENPTIITINRAVMPASNGYNTFIAFDSFNRPNCGYVGNCWKEDDDQDFSILSNKFKKVPTVSSNCYRAHTTVGQVIAELRAQINATNKDCAFHWYGAAANRFAAMKFGSGGKIQYLRSTDPYWIDTDISFSANTDYIFGLRHDVDANNVDYLVDRVSKGANITPYTSAITNRINFYISSTTGGTVLCDWILVRKNLDTEPAWGSWGNEASAYIPPMVTFHRV